MKTQRSGFTLVELLIVIVVIAILAAISVVAFTGIQKRARSAVHIHENAQTERAIATHGLQIGGQVASISGGSLVGSREGAGSIELIKPLTGTPDITMYGVLKVVGASDVYSTYAYLTPLTWSTHVFSLDVAFTGQTFMRSRVDTSAQLNIVASSPSGFYVSGRTVVCWLQAKHSTAVISLGCNQGAAHQSVAFNASHTGWNFTGLTLVDRSDKVITGLVFNEAHDETTRAQVVSWLAKKYSFSL